ncbi:MAG: class I SAM-dependent methyltransferase [Paracoccaceae bacterium]
MTARPASMYREKNKRDLTERLGLAPDALPGAGNWFPEEGVLSLLVDQVEAREHCHAVVCGSGLSVAVLARACQLAGTGPVWAIESDDRSVAVTRGLLARIGAKAHIIKAELTQYDQHNLWYARWSVSELPNRIDLLFLDGPGHFAGRTPRWPAGPELFPRLAGDGVVVLDDSRRVKEKKAMQRWAEQFPDLVKTRHKRGGGAALLSQRLERDKKRDKD